MGGKLATTQDEINRRETELPKRDIDIQLPLKELSGSQNVSVGLATAASADDCPIEVWHDVIAVRVAKGGRSPGGIIIPESAKEKTLVGTVVAVGPGRLPDSLPGGFFESNRSIRMPMIAKVGDVVVFPDLVGLEFQHGNVKYYCIHETDVLARVR